MRKINFIKYYCSIRNELMKGDVFIDDLNDIKVEPKDR